MIETEKRYWVNGYQIRGGWFKTYTFSLFGYGVLIAWGRKTKPKIVLYSLT